MITSCTTNANTKGAKSNKTLFQKGAISLHVPHVYSIWSSWNVGLMVKINISQYKRLYMRIVDEILVVDSLIKKLDVKPQYMPKLFRLGRALWAPPTIQYQLGLVWRCNSQAKPTDRLVTRPITITSAHALNIFIFNLDGLHKSMVIYIYAPKC